MTIALAQEHRGTQADTAGGCRRPTRAATLDLGEAGVEDLVRAASAGESRAWDELVRRYGRLVWAVTRAHGLAAADGADVYQVVWLQLVDNLDRLRDPERIGSWLATTARYECYRTLRRRGRVTPVASFDVNEGSGLRGPNAMAGLRGQNAMGDSLRAPNPMADDDRIDAVDRSDRLEPLAAIVATLPERHQALVRMLMLDPAPSYQEISEALGMPVGSIGPTRERILAVLRRKCEAAGLSIDVD